MTHATPRLSDDGLFDPVETPRRRQHVPFIVVHRIPRGSVERRVERTPASGCCEHVAGPTRVEPRIATCISSAATTWADSHAKSCALHVKALVGWRRKFGVLAPSTNTIVQPDFDDMRPVGVTNHYSRIFTPNTNALSNETFRAGIDTIGSNVMDAIKSVMTCEPDYLVMGISALSFFGGVKGADAFAKRITDETGLGLRSAATRELPR